MMLLFEKCVALARRFGSSGRGNAGLLFGLAAPALLGAVGLSVDYASWMATKSNLQNVADAAALIGARELRLGNATQASASEVARSAAATRLATLSGSPAITATTPPDLATVTVDIALDLPTYVAKVIGIPLGTARVMARARVLGGAPLCLLSLEKTAPIGLSLSLNSNITATNCAVYSNSASAAGMTALDSSVLKAAAGCSAGGYVGTTINFVPMPQTDCPALPDPFVGRAAPTFSAVCDFNNTVILGGSRVLTPGVYCGGLNVTLGANVTLAPGVYIIKDGPITVTAGSVMTGAGVGFYLTGLNSLLTFLAGSTIDLSAPTSGSMAGVLVWENAATALTGLPHIIYSDHAHNLLGTIYIPNGYLSIGSPNPVADRSAYTIIAARYVELVASPNLVLNTNYSATPVPTPAGLGPRNNSVALDR